MKTFGQLAVGSVVNYRNLVVADDTNYVILRHYESKWGLFTEVLNLNTYEKEDFGQHTQIKNQWSIVKEHE